MHKLTHILRGALPALLIILNAGALASCSANNNGGELPDNPRVFSFGFETGLNGFSADGADLEVGGEEIDWSIASSSEEVHEGSASAKLYADNLTDAAKIWLEQPLELEPGTQYEVQIDFDFATLDIGDFNHWTIIAGVLDSDPEDGSDLEPIYRGSTSAEADTAQSHVWLARTYTQTVTTGADGKLWLALGVWGTWETARTYYIDKLKVTATKL